MERAAVSWQNLADRARDALRGCSTLRARVRVKAPKQGTSGDAVESVLEVAFARPDLWRVDRDGELLLLRDGIRHLVRSEEGTVQGHPRRPDWVPGDEIGELGWGHRDLFRDPPAFEEALSGPVPVTVGGRDAWEVRLAAPGKKPYALAVALDRETGLVLRHAAEGTPYVTEVLDLVLNEELPEDRFSWDGEVEEVRMRELEESNDRHWVDELPLPRFWPAEPRWLPVRLNAATGAFQVRLAQGLGEAVLVRRPLVRSEDGEIDGSPHRHRHEWVDGEWRWTLLVENPLGAEDLARVQASIR